MKKSLKAAIGERRLRKLANFGKTPDACDVKSCRAPGAHKIMFRLWPVHALPGITQPLEGDMSLVVCETHAPTVKAAEFFHDHAWAQIVERLKAAGMAEPERASAEIFLVRIK